jgi:2-(1,2-epoxy-1,2-dihydrophenyl)acetyl-CoA isomerase
MNQLVLVDTHDRIATITLNRPERLNAMTPELLEQLLHVIERVADDSSVAVVVVTGAGRGFCAGGDLSEGAGGGVMTDETTAYDIRRLRTFMRCAQLLNEMPKIAIAAINGACAGAGLALACACDLRYCANNAAFNTAFLTAGLSGDFGGTWTLPRIVGPARARELYLLSEKFDAETAERIGLVSARVDPGDLDGHVRSVAETLLSRAPAAVQAVKANLNDSAVNSLSEQLDVEADRHIRCGRMADSQEAAKAFLEKRPPVFTGA